MLTDVLAELSEAQIIVLSFLMFSLYKMTKGISDILWWLGNQD